MAVEPINPCLSAFDTQATQACLTLPPKALREWFDATAQSRGLRTGHGAPLHMIDQSELPLGRAYETHIAQTGGLPTRDNLHDRFNALVWLHLPRLKALLNAVQAQEISRHGHRNNQRGPWRDWATLLDESGVVVLAQQDAQVLRDCWRGHDWLGLFWEHRSKWQAWQACQKGQGPDGLTVSCAPHAEGPAWSVWPVGHALLEKGQRPYKAITAQAWVLEGRTAPLDPVADPHALADDGFERWRQLDHLASQSLCLKQQAETERPARLWPLPIMGVPGWCPDNQEQTFYQDPQVFRPARS
ncbi:MAG: hypothetical protein RJB19_28 [Pseudomonadota bacterium]